MIAILTVWALLMQAHSAMAYVSDMSVRFLESNSWEVKLNQMNLLIDPVMSQLDFGVPMLYSGNKRVIDGPKELEILCRTSDYVVITQGFDDHAHSPTLKTIHKYRPDIKYVCPPSAVEIITSCGISAGNLIVMSPGEVQTLGNGKCKVDVRATTGALLGPPWAKKENGYLLRSNDCELPDNEYELYIEPHCMFDPTELKRFSSIAVIAPIVSQDLFAGAFPLVAGGAKSAELCDILNAKYLLPMANGNLKQTGPYSHKQVI